MSKAPSEATQIRTLKGELSRMRSTLSTALRQRDLYHTRATKAEQEAAEWKARFDVLLRKETP